MDYSGKRAVIDLDDTLGGLREVLMETFNRLLGQKHHWNSWTKLDMESVYGISNDLFLEIAESTMLLEQSRPHLEASSFMHHLKDAGIATTVLTARAWHPRAESMTKNWLGLYDIPYSDVVVCELEDDKADYIRHMDNVLFTVDDSVRHCNSYSAMTENRPEFVFAYDMPWNQNVVDAKVIPIKNLNHIKQYIEGL